MVVATVHQKQEGDSKTQTIANQRFTTSYSYDEHDRMTSKTYPSGKVVGYVYDDKGELMSLNIDGVPKVNYNKVSNITNIQSDAISRAFGYDNLDRLTSYEQNATDFQNFAYDANGNRLSQSQEENSSKTFDYLANSNILNTIQETKGTDTKEISYEYDATGNIIKDDKHTYSYDGRNRLTAIDNNVTYQYNYDNKRVSKTVNGVKTYFIYDGHMLIGEYQLNLSDQSRQEMVYLNSIPIATVTPTGTYRVYSDHLDTSRRVAENNEQAKVLWKWESKPFGESLANEDADEDGKIFRLNLRFPGQYFDAETKTHYNINRDYNPVTGRYIQSDPVGFDGGVNGFGYVGGRPIVLIDEEGLWCWFGWFRTCGVETAPKVLNFTGTFVTVAAVGVGGTVLKGNYTDGQTGKSGRFTSTGFAWGLDASIGGLLGEVYVKDAYSKFMGKGTSIGVGFMMVGGGAMFSNGNKIGRYFTVDGSPLPASLSFSATTTTEGW